MRQLSLTALREKFNKTEASLLLRTAPSILRRYPRHLHILVVAQYSYYTAHIWARRVDDAHGVFTEALECGVTNEVDKLQEQFGEEAICRFASFVTISEFGLSETEMLELLMPTSGAIDCVLRLEDGYFNFSTYAVVKRAFCTYNHEYIIIHTRTYWYTSCPQFFETILFLSPYFLGKIENRLGARFGIGVHTAVYALGSLRNRNVPNLSAFWNAALQFILV